MISGSAATLNRIAVLGFLALLPFVGLGRGEIEASDEALYAVRARSIVEHGDWLDQTEHSIGGLRSSSHPPLAIWATAAAYAIGGVNAFTSRLVAALSAIVLILCVERIARRIGGSRAGLIAAALAASSPLFLRYAQLGQLDMPCAALSAASAVVLIETTPGYRRAAIAGALLGAAFMSKLLMPATYAAGLLLYFSVAVATDPESRRSVVREALALFVVAALIAIPWHLWMFLVHGRQMFDAAVGYHLIARGTTSLFGAAPDSGPLHPINQLLISLPPLAAVAVVAVPWLRRSFAARAIDLTQAEKLVGAWLIGVVVCLAIVKTKLPSYPLQALAPAAILSSIALGRSAAGERTALFRAVLLVVVAASFAWAIHAVRLGARELLGLFRSEYTTGTAAAAAEALIGIALLALALVWLGRKRPLLLGRIVRELPGALGIALSLVALAGLVAGVRPERPPGGARSVAAALGRSEGRVVLIEHPQPAESAMADVQFYSDSPGLSRRIVPWSGDSLLGGAALPEADYFVLPAVASGSPSDSLRNGRLAALLQAQCAEVASTDRYRVFVPLMPLIEGSAAGR
jgi:hypothetical protein